MKRPAFQFYPADWRKDAALQSCSLASQGLWINLLCIAHECEPYGHLTINGNPMLTAQLARLVGLAEKDCYRLLRELVDAGVASMTNEGTTFSRRMVRDERLRNVRADAGRLGGNPLLLVARVNQTDNPPVNQQVNSNLTPSSSSSSSSSKKEKSTKPGGLSAFPPGFETFWEAYPRKVGKPSAIKAFARLRVQPELLETMLRAMSTTTWGEYRFIPHPATWLNDERWNDEKPRANDPFAGAI